MHTIKLECWSAIKFNEITTSLLVTLWGVSVNDLYVVGPLVSSVVDQLIIMSILRYLKPSVDSGGTCSNLGQFPDPNAESSESAKVLFYYNTYLFPHVQIMKSLLC